MQNNTFSRLFVGQNLVILQQVNSTNNYLKDELSKSAPLPEGTVILAEEQFAGRGQANNTWHSQPGENLTFSLLLYPVFLSPENHFLLNQSISIAINDALINIIGRGLKIKWPNDIYYNDNKLGGVLIENILRGSILKCSVIGIGLNINQDEFPIDIKNVTSLKKILHQDYDRYVILNELCHSIERRYLQLKAGKVDIIEQEYINNLYRLNERHKFIIAGREKEGIITGVDKNGFLNVIIDEELHRFNFKEIAFVNK